MILNQWYAVLPSKSVKKDGVAAVKRLNLDLVFFRIKSGELGCVADQCTHRGAALSIGCLKGDHLQCPFHGLEFDKNGACKFIPANGKASTEDLSRYNVKKYLVREANDIIYLWYGDETRATETLPFFNDYVDASYTFSEIEDYWNAHYSRSIENQLDVVHVPIVHYNTIGRGNATLVNGPKVIFENGRITTSANNEKDEGQKPKSASECQMKSTFLSFVFPNIWMNHITEKIKVIIYFAPVDDENTVLYIRFYCRISNIKSLNRFVAFTGKFANRVIERQDKRIVITEKPKASSLRSAEKLVAGDGPIILYRRLRDELQQNGQQAK